MLDLCRYTGASISFYRHAHLDFIAYYSREYPMNLEKYTYAFTHPHTMIHFKHKKIIPSWKTAPLLRKRYIKMKIKPPRQMSNKWFFQDYFSDTGLFVLHTTVCDLRYQRLGCCNSNQLVSFYCLNPQMYAIGDWGNAKSGTSTYKPWSAAPTTQTTISGTDWTGKQKTATITPTPYSSAISYGSGWFQKDLLQIAKPNVGQQVPPITQHRYNPTIDTGHGNKIWIRSILNTSLGPPTTDTSLILEDLPLWQLFFGFLNYCNKIKNNKYFVLTYFVSFQTKFCEPQPGTPQVFMPIDKTFINGQLPYGRFNIFTGNEKWFPTVANQVETINAIVQCGPYMPKLDNIRESTWELDSKYIFYFKWGGAQLPEAYSADPSKQADYQVPDKIKQRIQISNPNKQDPKGILHAWDFRRGFATKSALKRMLENTDTDTTFQISTDAESTPKKKKKTTNSLPAQDQTQEEEENCLLSLFEEPTCQETQKTSLQELINQQQQQQQSIKLNLLKLISQLKKKQSVLQLQTGLLD